LGFNLMPDAHNELEPLTVLIVGCGNIAGGFDKGRKLTDFPYTHAGAYIRDNRFKMAACIEPDEARRIEFMKEWNIQLGFSSIDEILNLDYRFDVISICSPTTYHSHDIEVALQLSPRLIFCEKPITTSLVDTERLVAACKAANVMMAVNHTRRWDPSISELQANILSGQMGELRSIVGVYNKGILNNGSHMLDLLHFLVGAVSVISVGKSVSDYLPSDPTLPVWLESEQGVPIHLVCAHAEDYAVFELQLIFSLGVLTMEEGGLYWRNRHAVESATFKGYRKLDDAARHAGEYPHAMIKAIDNIYRAITSGEALVSSGESALLAQRMCEKIKQMALAQ
jgi:predicted dehydrogenase